MKQIGKGAFTTAYKKNSNTVLLKSTDPVKDLMAHGQFPNSRMFPTIKPTDTKGEYIMKYYPKTYPSKKNLKPSEYTFYKELRNFNIYYSHSRDSIWEMKRAFRSISNKNKGKHLNTALDACLSQYDIVFFEISPRNVSVTPAGNLVLLDCFFFPHLL